MAGAPTSAPMLADALMLAGAPEESLEERLSLASLRARVFGDDTGFPRVSRYVLIERLGAGGSGVVYRARDPELDREVAIKLLHASATAQAHQRLLREARAIAALSHPNVIEVHDVGTYDGRELGGTEGRGVFVVMELVQGQTLRAWAQQRRRSTDAVVEVMRGAGRGLAAAHRVGLVHRDFKPDNVLVGPSGTGSVRPRVLDFGLARATTESFDEAMPLGADVPDGGSTPTRAPLGTPAYMAPEQHRGEPADARSDQFAFAVTLFELLAGVRPFSGGMEAMERAKTAGAWPQPPPAIPRHVRRVLRRAGAGAASRRYASMDDLLRALAGPSTTARWAAVLAAVAVLGAGAAGLAAPTAPAIACDGGRHMITAVWNRDRAETVGRSFASTGVAFADDAHAGVVAALDHWTEAWMQSHRDSCEDTHLHARQAPERLDVEMRCLSRRLHAVEATVDVLVAADPGVVERAVESVRDLPDPATCRQPDAVDPTQGDPRRVTAYARLDRVDAFVRAGQAKSAVQLARTSLDEARAIGDEALAAAAHLHLARALREQGEFTEAERALFEAIWLAEGARAEATAADAWIDLVWLVGAERSDTHAAVRWVRFAEAALRRGPATPVRRAALEHAVAGLRYREGKHDEALRRYRAALQLQSEEHGEAHPAVARTLNHIGNVLIAQGRLDEAQTVCRRSLTLRQQVLGRRHPLVAASHNNLGVIATLRDDAEAARLHAEAALELVSRTDRPEEAVAWTVAARAHALQGHDAEELAARRRGMALLDAHPEFDSSTRNEHTARIRELTGSGGFDER